MSSVHLLSMAGISLSFPFPLLDPLTVIRTRVEGACRSQNSQEVSGQTSILPPPLAWTGCSLLEVSTLADSFFFLTSLNSSLQPSMVTFSVLQAWPFWEKRWVWGGLFSKGTAGSSFDKDLLCTQHVPGTVLGPEVNRRKQCKDPCLLRAYPLVRRRRRRNEIR